MQMLNENVNAVKASQMMGLHRTTVERMCRMNRIPAKKVHNTWVIDRNDIEKYLLHIAIKDGCISQYGQKLKSARYELKLSQYQLAVILGVSPGAISRWEKCNRIPRSKNSQQILRWLQQKS